MTVVFNEFAETLNSILARQASVRRTLTIRPLAVRRSSKRARRAAFYARARMCRLMTRIACAGLQAQDAELQERFRNVVVYGTSHPEAWAPPRRTEYDDLFAPDWKHHDGENPMTEAPQAPRTVEAAAALPEVTAADVWAAPLSGLPLDGEGIAMFSTGDGRVWRVVPHDGQWKKMEQR